MRRPCLGCGALIRTGSRCTNCKPPRQVNGWHWTQTKRKVHARDGNQCTHVEDGIRCPITTTLFCEHRVPQHEGGTDRMENLTTRCTHHRLDTNQYA